MKSYHGIAVSAGIAIAKALVFREEALPVPRYEIPLEDAEPQYQRFVQAVRRASEDLVALRDGPGRSARDRALLDAHLLMLDDADFLSRMRRDLAEKLTNVEWLLVQYAEELAARIGASEDEYMRERAADVRDVTQRVMNHLLHRERLSLQDIAEEAILVGHNLLPSDALMLNPAVIRGLALDMGGKTSHTAIIARAFGIPAVLGLRDASRSVLPGESIIVDGHAGIVVVDPDTDTAARYHGMRSSWLKHEEDLDDLSALPAETPDGRRVRMDANIEVPGELDAVLLHGAEGIGLFRSEFLYLSSKGEPSEAEQTAVYSEVLRRMKGRPVTIRTFDLGGDKSLPGSTMREEENPILGWRAIRYCLANPRLFRTQLRALLRSSVHGDLRIMIPMISGVEELEAARELIEVARRELAAEGVEVAPRVPLGIMIEIPSAALTSDVLARKVDFFSIGTNDLMQYTLAVDRSNEKIAYLYEPFHLGVLRLLRLIIDNAHEAGIPVGLCGELAADPGAALVLLGMGVDELSMGPFSIAEVKRVIRGFRAAEAAALVDSLMSMKSPREAEREVARLLEERFGIDYAG
jgi:phosphoenolpyruvate-protein phosphotransferase (PTS system enzyme I)